MKLSVFGEYGAFTVVVLKKNSFPNTLNEIQHFRRKRRMKKKIEPMSANFRPN
jgi:hypothetical protein